MKDVAAELAQWLRTGEPVAIATVVRITGSAPRPLGATLIARSGEKIAGSVSNGCVESAVYEEAMAVLGDGRPRVVTYGISDEFAFTVGLSCGGAIDVLIEPIGALHRAALEAVPAERAPALAPLAKSVGYRVVVADPRSALADRERFPLADEILLMWPDEALARLRLGASTAVVILAHDAKFDHPALVAALRSDAGYIGAIGSRTTNEQRFTWLREQGFGVRDIARVYAPIGLDIGAGTAEEIALSILAEVVAVRYRRSGPSLVPGRARVIVNEDYASGLASSLQAGLRTIDGRSHAALVLLGDMPGVTTELISELMALGRDTKSSAVVSVWHGRRSPPAILHRTLWPAAFALRGDVGMREVLAGRDDVTELRVTAALGSLDDVDTPADHQRLARGG